MTIQFRRAVASEAKPLVGLYAESGGGKTRSALLLACGFCAGDMSKVFMIETEAGRGEAWADDPEVGGYNVLSLRESFSPKAYGEAMVVAERAGARALIVDSASHEWEGVGGVLSMAAQNEADGKKGVLVWQQPKIQHAREFMLRLQQTPIPLVVACMRAKYAMEQVTAKTLDSWDSRRGRPPKVGDWIRSSDLSPKQSEDILFEMFVHGWLDKEDHRFHLTKDTIPAMREIFRDGERITVDTGKRLAAWAAGKKPAPQARSPEPPNPSHGGTSSTSPSPAVAGPITKNQALDLEVLCKDAGVPVAAVLRKAEVSALDEFPATDYADAVASLKARIAQRASGEVRQ